MADESQSRCINEVLTFKQQVPAPPSASRARWLSGPRDGGRRGAAARSTRAATWKDTRAPSRPWILFILLSRAVGKRGWVPADPLPGAATSPRPTGSLAPLPGLLWGNRGTEQGGGSEVGLALWGEPKVRGFCGVDEVGGQEEGFGGCWCRMWPRSALNPVPVPPHRADRRRSGAVRGGESSSVAINLISISCLTMEKWHVVRGSKNRLGKLLTAFADVKGKTGASRGENTPWPCLGGVHPGPSRVGSSRPRGGGTVGLSHRLASPLCSASPLGALGKALGAGARRGRLCLTALPADPDL